jgi:hypothetical protein
VGTLMNNSGRRALKAPCPLHFRGRTQKVSLFNR